MRITSKCLLHLILETELYLIVERSLRNKDPESMKAHFSHVGGFIVTPGFMEISSILNKVSLNLFKSASPRMD